MKRNTAISESSEIKLQVSEEEHAVTKWARSTDDSVLEFIVSSPTAFLGRPALMVVVVDE